jgi:chromosome partitioning protein
MVDRGLCQVMVIWSAMTQILSLLALKGGSGKSTSAMCCALLLHRLGGTVVLVDLDPHKTCLSWRNTVGVPFGVVGPSGLEAALKSAQWVVIDTPPNDTKLLGDVARLSDYIIVPVATGTLEADRFALTQMAIKASGYSKVWGAILTKVKGRQANRPHIGDDTIAAFRHLGVNFYGEVADRVAYQRAFDNQAYFDSLALEEYEVIIERMVSND